MLEDYVTVPEAAERLGIHPESVRRLIRLERLPAKKFAHSWLIARDTLEQFASAYNRRPGNPGFRTTLFEMAAKPPKVRRKRKKKAKK